MEVRPIKTSLVQFGDNIVDVIIAAVEAAGLEIEDNDILLIADKIVAISQGRFVRYDSVKPSSKAKKLAKEYSLEPEAFAELILQEADEIYGGVPRTLLTLKSGILIANAGIDHKNAPPDAAVLWPANPNRTAKNLMQALRKRTGKRVGLILVDSHVNPMRLGTVGFALGIAGIKPLRDCRGETDLCGRPLVITQMNIADDLAASAHLLMGETAEKIPLVVIRGAPLAASDNCDPDEVLIAKEDCILMSTFLSEKKRKKKDCQKRCGLVSSK